MEDEFLHEVVIVLKCKQAIFQGEAFLLSLFHALRNLLILGRYYVVVLPELLFLQVQFHQDCEHLIIGSLLSSEVLPERLEAGLVVVELGTHFLVAFLQFLEEFCLGGGELGVEQGLKETLVTAFLGLLVGLKGTVGRRVRIFLIETRGLWLASTENNAEFFGERVFASAVFGDGRGRLVVALEEIDELGEFLLDLYLLHAEDLSAYIRYYYQQHRGNAIIAKQRKNFLKIEKNGQNSKAERIPV